MNTKYPRKTSKRNSKRRMSIALALAGVLAAGSANAQWVVSDPGHTALTQAGWVKELVSQGQQYGKQVAQYQKQIEQYQQQIKQYEQQYIKGGVFRGGMMGTQEFKPRALTEGMAERCPTSLRSMLSASSSAEKCALIVQTQNARFNALVDVLNKSKERNAELQRIYSERARISKEDAGSLQANTNQLTSFGEMMQLDMQRARSQTESFDTLLDLLNKDQALITETTLTDTKGGGVVGGLIRGSALHVALQAAKSRDR